MPEPRMITASLPEDLPNDAYGALVSGLQGLLHAAGLAAHSTIKPDTYITDRELNDIYDVASQHDPWDCLRNGVSGPTRRA
jgi:hypothetical protein